MLTLLVNPIQIYYVLFVADGHWVYAINPIGVYYVMCAILAFFGNKYAILQWLSLDKLAAATIHNLDNRTISGWAGQHMHSKKRYYYQSRFIDKLAILLGDEAGHCYREYLKELKKGLVKS